MSESLDAACGEFEQVILSTMLRTAGVGRVSNVSSNGDDDEAEPHAVSDAFQQLVVQALSGAIERAGGIGLRRALASALTAHKL
jgi:hypothetical protein